MTNNSNLIRGGIINLSLVEVDELYSCYMPFIKNSGLFVPTSKKFAMGDDVFVLLQLMSEPDKIPIAGKVVWISPSRSSWYRRQGVGVQFTKEDSDTLVTKIEAYLADQVPGSRPSYTL